MMTLRNAAVRLMVVLLIPIALTLTGSAEQTIKINLAADGQALFSVVVSTGATARIQMAATNLAVQLERITGAPFVVATGDGLTGLAVGVPADFPNLPITPDFHPELSSGREDYLLRTHSGGLYFLGATEQAVDHAVWDFLYRQGFRQFFPGPHWEIVPEHPKLTVALDTLQRPDFICRTMSSATSRGVDGFGDKIAYQEWMQRNRIADSWHKIGGHIYGFIIRARKEVFEAHPEYLALVDGKRQGQKFCVSNPALRKLVVEYALEQLAADPGADAVSMEPSDGGGFCECAECAKIGSVSTQVVLLANEVAEAVSKHYPDKYVSLLAYNFHTAPPEIRLHPRILVTICAGQLTGSWTPNELFEAWTAQGANASSDAGFGVFEYYSNIVGNRFLPGSSRASDITYMKRSITGFHERGARRLRSGAAYSNGTVSLGIYLASRMLWDIDEADRIDALYADFLEKAFGVAADPMDRYFRLIYMFEGDPPRMPLTGDTIGRMYRALQDAWPLAPSEAVRQRIQDLILYTRYAEMHLVVDGVSAKERAEAFGDVMRHAWRMRETMMVNVYGLFTYPPRGYPAEEVGWGVPAGKNPWKVGAFYTDSEIAVMLADGVANNPVGTYVTRAFSSDLVPAAEALGFEDQPLGPYGFGLPPVGRQEFFTWVEDAPGTVTLRVAGGFIWPKRADNVRITLYSDQAVSDAADFVVTTDTSVPPDQEEHTVVLRTPHPGMHRVVVEGGSGATTVLPGVSNMFFTVQAGPSSCFNRRHMWDGWFYVPQGTQQLSFHVSEPASGDLFDGDGNLAFSFRKPWTAADGTTHPPAETTGFHTIDLSAAQAGRLWRLSQTRAAWLFLNVPPYLARRPSELLLPKEIVEADRKVRSERLEK